MKPIALKKMLTLPFILLISISVLVTSYFTWAFSKETTSLLGEQISQQSASRIKESLHHYFNYAQTFNETLKEPIGFGLIDVNNREDMLGYIAHIAKNNPDVATLSYAYPDGSYMGISNTDDGDLLKKVASPATNRMFYTSNLKTNEIIQKRPDYDARRRNWFKEAKAKNSPIWSSVFKMYSSDKLGITYAEALYDAKNKFIGVVGTDIVFEDLNKELNDIKITDNSYLFILDEKGQVVAQSDATAKTKAVDLAHYSDSDNQVLKQAVNFIYGEYGFKTKPIHAQTEFEQDGKHIRYSVNSIPYVHSNGLKWYIGVVIPENDFMGKVNEIRKTTFYIWLLSFCLSIILGFLITYFISREMNKLRDKVTSIEKIGGLFEHNKGHSIKEVNDLSEAFSVMSRRLYESYLDVKLSNEALENIISKSEGLEEMNQKLKVPLNTDDLTGLPDRRSFDCFLQFYWSHLMHYEEGCLTLILCDLSFFKQYNEKFGYIAGDDCLKRFGTIIAQSAQSPNIVARYASNQFAIIMPNKNADDAVALAKRIFTKLDEKAQRAKKYSQGKDEDIQYDFVSVSMGIASTCHNEISDKYELLKGADIALDLAKKKGKNSLMVYKAEIKELLNSMDE